MKKTIFIAIMMIFTLSATTFASKTDLKSNATVATENKLSAEEVSRLNNRVEEIRKMDKSDMSVSEKRELRKESKSIKENVRKSGEVIYIGGSTLLLIIILILIL